MKKVIFLFVFTACISNQIFSQIKFWDTGLKKHKASAIILKLDPCFYYSKEEKAVDQTDQIKALITLPALGAATISYAISAGNYLLKTKTARNEDDFKFESSSLNPQSIEFETLIKKNARILSHQYFYKKGKAYKKTNDYSFIFKYSMASSILDIELENSFKEEYLPVKLKKNYNFTITSFVIKVSALINSQLENGMTYKKSITTLGSVTIYKTTPDFKDGQNTYEILNKGAILIPTITDKGGIIEIEKLFVTISINNINPIGTTSSSLNDFLENMSDSNEEFLNTILVGDDS